MNIDPTTGLPELPEGYFWEVAPHMEEVRAGNKYGGYSEPWKVRAGYEVRIMAHCTESKQGEKRWSWGKREITYTETSAAVKSQRLIDPVKQAEAEAEYIACGVWDLYHDYFSSVHYDHITPELVLEFATKCYTEWQDELEVGRTAKAKREASDALVGVYPPKVLR